MTAQMSLPPVARKLRAAALAYPETHEDLPWGHSAIKVRGKVFVFLGAEERQWSISVKLPVSAAEALQMDGVDPTSYGLGKHGWVTGRFDAKTAVAEDVLLDWLAESYRAVMAKAPARKKTAAKTIRKKVSATRKPARSPTKLRTGGKRQ